MSTNTTPPNTTTMTNHGMVIRANGTIIGAIHQWTTDISRTVTEVRSFGGKPGSGPGIDAGSAGPGEAYELVPGNVGKGTISVNRYDLYANRMEEAFGTPDMNMLSQQHQAFTITEYWNEPNNTAQNATGTATIGFLKYGYTGCWFTKIGRTQNTTDDRIVKVNATIEYVRRYRL